MKRQRKLKLKGQAQPPKTCRRCSRENSFQPSCMLKWECTGQASGKRRIASAADRNVRKEPDKQQFCKRCENCRFAERGEGPDEGLGECHRNPPRQSGNGGSVFPIIQFDDWCGEFQANPKEPAP